MYFMNEINVKLQKLYQGTSLMVQWLRLHSHCRGPGSISSQGTTSHATKTWYRNFISIINENKKCKTKTRVTA